MAPSAMHRRELEPINKAIQQYGEWWIDTRRVHPERQIKVAMVRSPEAESIAREFFATVAKDAELLCRRAGILLSWSIQRKEMAS